MLLKLNFEMTGIEKDVMPHRIHSDGRKEFANAAVWMANFLSMQNTAPEGISNIRVNKIAEALIEDSEVELSKEEARALKNFVNKSQMMNRAKALFEEALLDLEAKCSHDEEMPKGGKKK